MDIVGYVLSNGPELLAVVATVVVGYLAHSIRRQVDVRVAERRITAYSALWSRMRIATPVRSRTWVDRPLTAKERHELFDVVSAWYYEDGNGMLLGNGARSLYLQAKDNLVCPDAEFIPTRVAARLRRMHPHAQDRERSTQSIRQLSLLRTRMKADLGVFGRSYQSGLTDDDRAFLEECGERLFLRPWTRIPIIGSLWRRSAATTQAA